MAQNVFIPNGGGGGGGGSGAMALIPTAVLTGPQPLVVGFMILHDGAGTFGPGNACTLPATGTVGDRMGIQLYSSSGEVALDETYWNATVYPQLNPLDATNTPRGVIFTWSEELNLWVVESTINISPLF